MVPLAAPPVDDPDLLEACGENPGFWCEVVFDATGGNDTAAGAADWLLDKPLQILIIVVVAWIISRIARRYIGRVVRRVIVPDPAGTAKALNRIGVKQADALIGTDDLRSRREARAAAISSVLGSTLSVAIWTVAAIIVLSELGVDIGPLIAGAGIAGVALGFGAQSLVKDCIAGLFMLLEDQYGIGDIVDLGEATGTVEEITLRMTRLRGLDGTVWYVPNGEVVRVGNMSQLWSVALIDVDVAYDTDLERAREIILATANSVCESPEWVETVIEPPSVLGVETLGADGITLRMVVKTTPGKQWALQRTLREALKRDLDGAGIEIPFPQRTVWMRNEAE